MLTALGAGGLSLLILLCGDRKGDRRFRACKAYSREHSRHAA